MPERNSKLTSNKKEYNATRHEKAGAKYPTAKSVKSAAPTIPHRRTEAVEQAAPTTPRGKSEAVEQATSTTPHGTTEAVEQAAPTTPCGKSEAVEQAAPTTPCGKSEAVKSATSTTPCGDRTNGNTRCRKMKNATEKEGYATKENNDGAKVRYARKKDDVTKDGHTTKTSNNEKNGDAASRVFYCFILSSFIFALVVIPTRVIFDEVYRASTEYRLILFQLTAGLVFLRLPRLLSRPLGIDIPHGLYIAYMLFLWAAIFLGEFALLYYRVPFWDTLMHFFSAVLLTLLGLSLPTLITGEEISPLLCTILAVGFSVTVGVLWEVYEFSFDGILGLNMQKFATLTRSGLASLTGRAALTDTMTDLIVDLIGSLVPSVAAGIYIRKNGRLPPALTVSRCK